MTELNKRILTSFLLIILLILSINYLSILILILFVCFYLIFYEFYFMLKKIFKKKRLQIYIISIFLILYLANLNFLIINIFINNINEQKIFLYFIIVVCIFTDIGGYVFGKALKGKKLTNISPNKTYSGLVGSFLLSVAASLLLFNKSFNLGDIVYFSIILSSISQIGDLFISFLKRKAKIKDTGNLLPGHGGVLDRLDGIIFAIPIGIFIF